VETKGHEFLLRGGFVRQLTSGIFGYLPLARRTMRKIEGILREEMDATGGQEMEMPVVMGSYGIGVGRLMACIAEEQPDEDGLVWPVSVAPYHVHLVAHETLDEMAASLCDRLEAAGFEVLHDDREVSLGVKFKDADRIGAPIRLTLTPRSLENGGVEIKRRSETGSTIVSPEKAVAAIREHMGRLEAGLSGIRAESRSTTR